MRQNQFMGTDYQDARDNIARRSKPGSGPVPQRKVAPPKKKTYIIDIQDGDKAYEVEWNGTKPPSQEDMAQVLGNTRKAMGTVGGEYQDRPASAPVPQAKDPLARRDAGWWNPAPKQAKSGAGAGTAIGNTGIRRSFEGEVDETALELQRQGGSFTTNDPASRASLPGMTDMERINVAQSQMSDKFKRAVAPVYQAIAPGGTAGIATEQVASFVPQMLAESGVLGSNAPLKDKIGAGVNLVMNLVPAADPIEVTAAVTKLVMRGVKGAKALARAPKLGSVLDEALGAGARSMGPESVPAGARFDIPAPRAGGPDMPTNPPNVSTSPLDDFLGGVKNDIRQAVTASKNRTPEQLAAEKEAIRLDDARRMGETRTVDTGGGNTRNVTTDATANVDMNLTLLGQSMRKMGMPEEQVRGTLAALSPVIEQTPGSIIKVVDQIDPTGKLKQAITHQTATPQFKEWFGASRIVEPDGTPKVYYSGHGNVDVFGAKFDKRKATSGAFYATSDPDIASNYALSKWGNREVYENGSQYKIVPEKGRAQSIWDVRLTPEQRARFDEWFSERYGENIDSYLKENAPYDREWRTLIARGGGNNLGTWWKFMEYMGDNIAYAKHGDAPLFERQVKNDFEELMDAANIRYRDESWNQPGVLPMFVSVKNPLVVGDNFPPDLLAELKAAGGKVKPDLGDTQWTKEYPLANWVKDIEDGNEFWATQVPAKAVTILRKHGYDGILDKGGKLIGNEHDVVVFFDPTQAKSAIGNRGTFDATKADMRFQQGPEGIKGAYDPRSRVIELAQGKADVSTIIHEVAHDWHGFLKDHPEHGPVIRKHYGDMTDEAGAEAFARHFEKFLATGKSPVSGMQRVFEAVRDWMKSIYSKWSHGEAPAEVQAIFKRAYDNPSERTMRLVREYEDAVDSRLRPDASTAETGPSDFYTEGGGTTPPADPPSTANGAPGGNSGTPNPNNGKSTIDDIPKFSGGPDVPQPDLFAPEVTKAVKAKANRWKILDAVGRDVQLANPMGRLLDLASNTARIAGGAAESTLRNVVSVAQRLAAKGDTYLVSEHPMWGTKFKRVYGGQKASPLKARMRSDLKYGHATYGKGGVFSKLAGIGDVPFREYHYRSMLSDVADNFVRGSGRKGVSNPSKMNSEQVFQSLLKGEAVPGLDVQGMREAAEAYAAHMTYNADNLASAMIKSVEGALDNAAATSTSAVSAGTTNAAHYLIFKPMTRYSKVIGNVAIDRFQRSFFGVPALAEAVAKSTIKGGKPLTPYQARYVTNLVGKGGAAAGISALGVIAVQNGWVKPKIMKTENGTVFVDWGDWEQIGGPAHPFMYAATMAAIDKSSLTDNQKQDAKYKYATNMLLNQPAVTGPQRALRATESPEGIIDYMANFAASMVIPGGMRDFAERLDEYNQSQAAPYDQAVPRNRKAKGPLSQVQKKVPVWREQLPIKTDKRVPN